MTRLLILAACAALAGPLFPNTAFAGQPVTLKAEAVDADGLVTLGDLFDGAGAAARSPVATRAGQSVMLDALVVQAAARRAGLDWPNAEGLRRIVVRAGAAGGTVSAATPRGNVDVLTYARSLAAGEVVQPQDLVWGKAAAAPADAATDPEALIGMAAKRPLRAGAVAVRRDVGAAQVVKLGDIVTVAYDNGGISLSLQGRALGSAGVGEMLNVQNTISKKTVQAVVTGPGQAVVGPAAEQLRLSNPTHIASR